MLMCSWTLKVVYLMMYKGSFLVLPVLLDFSVNQSKHLILPVFGIPLFLHSITEIYHHVI